MSPPPLAGFRAEPRSPKSFPLFSALSVASADTVILLIVDSHAAIWGKTPVAPCVYAPATYALSLRVCVYSGSTPRRPRRGPQSTGVSGSGGLSVRSTSRSASTSNVSNLDVNSTPPSSSTAASAAGSRLNGSAGSRDRLRVPPHPTRGSTTSGTRTSATPAGGSGSGSRSSSPSSSQDRARLSSVKQSVRF